MKTAFVLSGGGSLGAVQVGMLQALADLEVTPDLLVGTSAGALNAGYLAGHGTDRASVDNLAEVWQRLRTLELFAPDLLRVGLALADRGLALLRPGAARPLIKRHLKFTDLKDAPIPLWVVATDLLTGAEVHRNHGPALELIAASSAIPGMTDRSTSTVKSGRRFAGQRLGDLGGTQQRRREGLRLAHRLSLRAAQGTTLGRGCVPYKAPRCWLTNACIAT